MTTCPNIVGFFYNNTVSNNANIQFNNIQKFLKQVQNTGCSTLKNYVANKMSKVSDESSGNLTCSKIFDQIKADVISSNNIDVNTKNILIPILQDIISSFCNKNIVDQNKLKSMIVEFNKSFCYQEW